MVKINYVIPVRNGSKRVPNKNFRPYIGNKSLLEIKVEQLLKCTSNDNITINGDRGPAEEIAKKYSVRFNFRESFLTSSSARPFEVWTNIASHYNPNEHLAYVLCNNPFFDYFKKSIEIYKNLIFEKKYSGLASVTLVKKHLIDFKGNPLGFGFGENWLPSENLNYLYEINGGVQIGKVSEIIKTKSLFGKKPRLFDFGCQSYEIDNKVEFENSISMLESKLNKN